MEQSHVMNLIVLGSDSTVPVTAAAATIEDYADLDDGAFSVCNDENVVLSAASVLTDDRVALTGIKLVGRYGTKLVHTDMIKSSDIITYRAIADAADAEQVTHLGYTGSAGAIQIINDNVYKIKVDFYEQGRTGQGINDFVSVYYESDSSATGTEVVYGIEELLRLSFNRQAERPIYLRVLNSAALDTNLDFDANVTVVNGSKFIVSAADWSTDGAVEIAAVGDSIRLGSATETDAAVALGSSVYRVVAIPAADTIELDRPVTGVSGTYTASTDVQLIKAATANAASWGIEFHGIARTHIVGKRPHSKVSFTLGIEDFGTTTVTYTTAMSLGHGNPEQIEDLEWFTEGNAGYKYRGDYMYNPSYTSRVTSTSMYNQIAITWGSNSRSESIGGPGHNPKQLIIAIDTLYDDNDANDIVIDVLDAWSTIASGLGV
jgi:hypothetical protein